MKKRKYIVIAALVIIVAAGSYFFLFPGKNKVYTWKTAPVKQGKISVVIKATGTVNADTTVQVGTQVTGTIWKLYADFNSVVRKGQVIAILDTTFLSASRIDAKASLDKAQAQYDQAKRDFDRNKELLNDKVIAQSDYETTLTALALAKSAVSSAKAQLNHAKVNLDYAIIRAPVNGVVISRNVELGQTVVSSFNSVTLFSIANDLTKMQVQANVDEADIGQCKVGQKVNFTVDAFPDEVFKGEISQIRIQPVTIQNVVNYIVIISVANPDLKLLPGLTANINIVVEEHDNVLKIPANALSYTPPAAFTDQLTNIPDSIKTILKLSAMKDKGDNPGKMRKPKWSIVWLKKGSSVIPEKVRTGITDGTFTEVTGNIRKDDEVITGEAGSKNSGPQAAKSPFMPQFPGRR